MARLRLFANLRESAGTGTARFPGGSVGEVLSAAVSAYGREFEAGLQTAKVWVNGDPAASGTSVSDDDEIALIPPVSGGSTPVRMSQDTANAALVLALVAALAVANLVSKELFALAAVGVALAWLWDVRDIARLRGSGMEVIPVMVSAAAAGNGAYAWGAEGLAAGVAAGLIFQLAWAVLDPRHRSVAAIARATGLGIAAGLAAGTLVLIHRRSEDEVTLFLVLAAAAALSAWALQRLSPGSASLDPNVVGLIGAIVVGGVAAFTTDVFESAFVVILAALGVGVGFIAGRALGALMRIDQIVHTRPAPGLLTALDGPLLAATMFWFVVSIFG